MTTMNQPRNTATVTVTFDGRSVTFDLGGTGLSRDSRGGAYAQNAVRDFVADEVEKALKSLVSQEALDADIAAAQIQYDAWLAENETGNIDG